MSRLQGGEKWFFGERVVWGDRRGWEKGGSGRNDVLMLRAVEVWWMKWFQLLSQEFSSKSLDSIICRAIGR